jgi:hypothetical protein
MSFHYGTPDRLASIVDLIDRLPDRELSKPSRSTVPLLAWWLDDGDHPSKMLRGLGLGGPKRTTFEYAVSAGCSTCKGRGKASFTDVMLESDDYAVAIEAKYTEDLYQTVGKWLGKPAPPNRTNVLRHWTECCLKASAGRDASALVYQMVHRAASAKTVSADGNRSAHVVHLLFDADHLDKYKNAIKQVRDFFSDASIHFSVVLVRTTRKPDYAAIEQLDKADRPQAVYEALVSRQLFEFSDPEVLPVT